MYKKLKKLYAFWNTVKIAYNFLYEQFLTVSEITPVSEVIPFYGTYVYIYVYVWSKIKKKRNQILQLATLLQKSHFLHLKYSYIYRSLYR